MTRLERVLANLACPTCGTALARDGKRVACPTCAFAGEVESNRVVFGRSATSTSGDWLLSMKERVKRSAPRLYGWLISAISPVYAPGLRRPSLQDVDPATHFVIEFGSGPLRTDPNVINVDIAPYDEVDLVTSGGRVPLRDGCVDGILSLAVLEHVADPIAVVADFHRLLKPGGRLYVYVPFMQGVHAAPDDFTRWTPHGLERLFAAFDERVVSVSAGPSSALAWIAQEWFAMAFSFGSRRLYRLLYLAGFAFAPLKFFDAALRHHPMAANIASGYVITARKPLVG